MNIRPKALNYCWLPAVFAALALYATPGEARKPQDGGGGGGGSDYTVLTLDPQLSEPLYAVRPVGINDHNSVVGYAEGNNNNQGPYLGVPIFWSVSGGKATAFHLGALGQASGVNNHDEIVGHRGRAGFNELAVYWPHPLAPSEDLPMPEGHTKSFARKINDQGFIVGWSDDQAVAWRVAEVNNETVVSKPLLLGGLDARDVTPAEEIADEVFAARVCGTAIDEAGVLRAVTWELGSFVDEEGELVLEVVGGPVDLGTPPSNSFGVAINVHGDVCGQGHGDVTGAYGFRKLFGQPVEPLLPPPSFKEPYPAAIPSGMNEHAEIVGHFAWGPPVLWLADGTPVDLNKYSKGTDWAAFRYAFAINNSGTIVGEGLRYTGGRNSDRETNAFMLLPNQ